MRDSRDVIKRPIITEKSSDMMAENKYTFEVDRNANKLEVKYAVEERFDVEVEKVNIMNVKPKKRRVGRYQGYTPAVKKAIVKLKEGNSIEIFEV
ncbi:50S ribosomal protein L23 [Haloplasma contractile]|uniref:Large ribosomal subunit protein uL23 n=1 Tax=Haloplasma contractile SSD-17B TaxID=1033810 RepID=U2EC78_9MOLU|nr:50S ribosomal protein L23 [Haloplasma contractile]ERJ12386.1 50S ribosomal protein L23 [Haloplasma contractile SSD-17B]